MPEIPSKQGRDPAAAPPASLLLLVFIAFSGTLAMHVFVPALPAAALALNTDSRTIQMTITVYILGLALGQLVYGPISDAIGRRKAVISALSIYIAGSVASFLAPTADLLIAARFIQALGGAGGLAITRVIVADTTKGTGATKSIAILNLILLLGPGIAPVIGAQLSQLFGWRFLFIALTAMASVTLAFAIVKLPETTVPSRSLNAGRVYAGFREVVRNKGFFRIATGGAFGTTACYGYFVSAPFILGEEMGLSVEAVGYCVGSTLAAAALGTIITRSIVGKVRDRSILLGFSAMGATTGAAFLAAAIGDILSPPLVVTMSLVLLMCSGAMGVVAMGVILRLAGPQAASASGLYGCFQMIVGVLCTFAASVLPDHVVGCGLVLSAGYLICFVQFVRGTRII